MIYAYKCRECGARAESATRADRLPEFVHLRQDTDVEVGCPGSFTRDYSGLQFAGVMQEHYNFTTHSAISSNRQFSDQLKRISDERSNELGMEHRFEPVDPVDKKALGVTDEGMDATNRQRRKEGLPPFRL